ncbi:MAG: glycosyltransferase family 1 protein [Gemmataceae bacterium]
MDARQDGRPVLWVDVGTMAGWRGNPTGIARTLGQLLRHWLADDKLPLRLCRKDPVRQVYVEVDASPFRDPTAPRTPPKPSEKPAPVTATWHGTPPARLSGEIEEAWWHLGQAAKSVGRLGRAGYRRAWNTGRRLLARLRPPAPMATFARGDVLFIGGASWKDSPSPDVLQQMRTHHGVRIANLVYDIIPLRCPHLCAPDLTRALGRWLPGVLSCSDLVVTISEQSVRDLEEYGRTQALALPPLARIRLGDEPGESRAESAPPELVGNTTGAFVLCVSTLGLNKNHHLLFQVWRRLLDRHGGGVPTLVLAGAPGWRADQILRELRADGSLARHVVHLPRADDPQLRWLYRHCLFTVFPSHYEGWGLPVAESLAHGKCCICSNAASLPEVGGSLVDYHDPLDGPRCQQLIERALLEPGWLARREEVIRREFRVTPWQRSARQTLELLQTLQSDESRQAREAA